MKLSEMKDNKNYISDILKSKYNYKDIFAILHYTFADISKVAINSLIKSLEKISGDGLTDDKIAQLIYSWYQNLSVQDRIGFTCSDSEYLNQKAKTIADLIDSATEEILENRSLLDIGSGNCAMTYYVSEKLKYAL
jgi:hypothetical protein